MVSNLQQCFDEVLTIKINQDFRNKPYLQHALTLANSGRTNPAKVELLDFWSDTKEFSSLIKQTGYSANILLGSSSLYHSSQFDSVSISDLQCDSIKLFLSV